MHGKYYFCPPKFLTLFVFSASFLVTSAKADFRDEIDYTKLKAEYGTSLPTGQGVKIAQIEALRDGAWATPATGELSAKTFTYFSSIGTVYSSHASDVGTYLGGSASSMTPGLDGWPCFESSYYTMRSLLSGRSADPAVATWDVENHSWGGTDAMATVTLEKMDFRIDRDADRGDPLAGRYRRPGLASGRTEARRSSA